MHVAKERSVSIVFRPNNNDHQHCAGIEALLLPQLPHQKLLFTASRDSTVKRWDVSGAEPVLETSFDGHADWVNDLALIGDLLITCSNDRTVRLWGASTDNGQHLHTLSYHSDYVTCVAAAPASRVVVSAGLRAEVFAFDVETGKHSQLRLRSSACTGSVAEARDRACSVYAVATNPAATVVAAGTSEALVRLMDPRVGQGFCKLRGHKDTVRSLLLNSDGSLLLSGGSDGAIKLWDLGMQRCVQTYRVHSDSVWSLAAPDDSLSLVYSAGRDRAIRRTRTLSGASELLAVEERPVAALALDPDVAVAVQDEDVLGAVSGATNGLQGGGVGVWAATLASHVNMWLAPRRMMGNATLTGAAAVTATAATGPTTTTTTTAATTTCAFAATSWNPTAGTVGACSATAAGALPLSTPTAPPGPTKTLVMAAAAPPPPPAGGAWGCCPRAVGGGSKLAGRSFVSDGGRMLSGGNLSGRSLLSGSEDVRSARSSPRRRSSFTAPGGLHPWGDEHRQPLLRKACNVIPGIAGIVAHEVLDDRRRVLVKDAEGHVALWDVLRGSKIASYGQVEFSAKRRELSDARSHTPTWFTCDTRLGCLCITLTPPSAFSAEEPAVGLGYCDMPGGSKVNLGKLILECAFAKWRYMQGRSLVCRNIFATATLNPSPAAHQHQHRHQQENGDQHQQHEHQQENEDLDGSSQHSSHRHEQQEQHPQQEWQQQWRHYHVQPQDSGHEPHQPTSQGPSLYDIDIGQSASPRNGGRTGPSLSRSPGGRPYYRDSWPKFWECMALPAVICSRSDGVRWRRLISSFDGSEPECDEVPTWVADVVLRGASVAPLEAPCTFLLLPAKGCGLPELPQDRHKAPYVLKAHSVAQYCCSKLQELGVRLAVQPYHQHRVPLAPIEHPLEARPGALLDLTCNGYAVPLDSNLAAVRKYLWRAEEDMVLHYGVREPVHLPAPSVCGSSGSRLGG